MKHVKIVIDGALYYLAMKNGILQCSCDTCLLFQEDGYKLGSRQAAQRVISAFDYLFPGHCDLCGRDDLQLIRYIPLVVIEFFKTRNICWCCRNHIQAIVRFEHGLCWSADPDEALKWALVDVVLDRYRSHFSRPGHTGPHDFREWDCCTNNGFHIRKIGTRRKAYVDENHMAFKGS